MNCDVRQSRQRTNCGRSSATSVPKPATHSMLIWMCWIIFSKKLPPGQRAPPPLLSQKRKSIRPNSWETICRSEAGDSLDAYLDVLDNFLKETAAGPTSATPAPQPKTQVH